MIAILRKNVASLISDRISFVCKRGDPFSLSLKFFSSLGETKLVTSARIYDVMVHKHQISPQVASVAASTLSRCRNPCPEQADSMLSFLEESGFSSTQLEKIVKFRPRILAAGCEDDIKFKIKIFQDLGLSPEDLAEVISSQMVVLNLSAKDNIIPSLSLLKDFFGGSNHDMAKILRRYGSILTKNLGKTLVPNVAFLKSCGIPMERIRMLLLYYPRSLLLKPDVIRKSADKAKEIGVSRGMFVHAVGIISSMSEETWEVKRQAFRNLGFSDSHISAIMRKAPPVFTLSTEKIRTVTEFLLATGKFDIGSIVSNPTSLSCSIEKRYKPRLRVLGILESKNLINKWPRLGTLYQLTDDKFFKKFIGPYSNELGEEFVTKSYVTGKER